MNTIVIFFIIFFSILIVMYPIIRIVYFSTSKKNIRNKILNLVIMIISFILTYFILRSKVDFLMKMDLGKILNSKKEMILVIITLIFASILETLINTIINLLIIRRNRNR